MGNTCKTKLQSVRIATFDVWFKSKNIILGRYAEYRDFAFQKPIAGIPEQIYYSLAVYDFSSRYLVLMDKKRKVLCLLTGLEQGNAVANFIPVPCLLLAPFQQYFANYKIILEVPKQDLEDEKHNL
jgi:hypothetical protein